MEFDSLLKALEGWFDTSIADLPVEQRYRVESAFALDVWDKLPPEERRRVAADWDDEHDPSTEPDRKRKGDFLNFLERKEKIKREIEKLAAFPATSDADIVKREARIAERKRAFTQVEHDERRWGGQLPDSNREPSPGQTPAAQHTVGKPEYIPCREAFNLLATKMADVTLAEMGAWVWLGRESGGLAAYRKPNQRELPVSVTCVLGNTGDFDYLDTPLMACWFNVEEINRFQPTDRFITGKALIERWGSKLACIQPEGIQPEAFIRAKVNAQTLQDFYPMHGKTQWSVPNKESFPPLEIALFLVSEVKAIEKAESIDVMVPSKAEPNRNDKLEESWQFQARQIGEQWLKQRRSAGENPGVIAISRYVEGELTNRNIKGKRGKFLDWETIKKEAMTGITGRKAKGKK